MLEVKTARMSAMRNREQLSRQQYSSSERINIAIEVVATAQQQYSSRQRNNAICFNYQNKQLIFEAVLVA